ncbi:hypothetical protein T492DRAFT_1065083 [Pavlovales sp. CCMP2436]|nr:hypothetical protein T492DRAFT_1065083 [Pavlovales sp. CCMP2436]
MMGDSTERVFASPLDLEAAVASTEADVPASDLEAAEASTDAPAPAPSREVVEVTRIRSIGFRSDNSDTPLCYVCLEDDPLQETLTGICRCLHEHLHPGCLEQLLNSKKGREKPLPMRVQCAICASAYSIPLTRFVLVPERESACVRIGSLVEAAPLVFVGIAGIGAVMLYRSGLAGAGLLAGLIAIIVLLASAGAYAHRVWFGRTLAAREVLNDRSFYAREVRRARREALASDAMPESVEGMMEATEELPRGYELVLLVSLGVAQWRPGAGSGGDGGRAVAAAPTRPSATDMPV